MATATGKFGEGKAGIEIVGVEKLKDKDELFSLLQALPEFLDMAIDFCKAPRHFENDKEGLERLMEDRLLRRKWFGKKRGTVRHTFADIQKFIDWGGNTLVVELGGKSCSNEAWAYTEDDQDLKKKPRINLCCMFFNASWQHQLATLVHELTHLIRKTKDFERQPDEEDLFVNPFDEVDIDEVRRKNRNFFKQQKDKGEHISAKKAARSAYNYQHFCEDLLKQEYDSTLYDACQLRKGTAL